MKKIDEAKKFIENEVLIPSLECEELSKSIKNKIISTKTWINKFSRIGDLYLYLNRFTLDKKNEMYESLKSVNLKTFEELVPEFNSKYTFFKNELTNASSFVIGNVYDSYDILIFAQKYDTRAGGMFVLGNNEAVIIKATLKGGMYQNEWLKKDESLKYFMKSINGIFKETYKENKAIIDNKNIPIYTFVRNTDKDDFIYKGIFIYKKHETKENKKWFILNKNENTLDEEIFSADDILESLNEEVNNSINNSTSEERQVRLKKQSKKPEKIYATTIVYKRNPDVIAEVLLRANGVCEECGQKAPFIRKKDNTPYLEVHHKKQLSEGGDDSIDNAIALCPNCHREKHFGLLN
jgi:5-methylcytosine-specific restriction enzyme A